MNPFMLGGMNMPMTKEQIKKWKQNQMIQGYLMGKMVAKMKMQQKKQNKINQNPGHVSSNNPNYPNTNSTNINT